MPATLTKDGEVLKVDLSGCRGSEFGDVLEKVRAIPGRQFIREADPDDPAREIKYWQIPADPHSADRILKTINPSVSDDLTAWVRSSMVKAEETLTSPLPGDAKLLLSWANKRLPHQPEEVNGKPFTGLFPEQRAAVEKMAAEARAVNADDMGFGKTIEAIAAVEEWRLHNGEADGPKLVVAPSSVKGGWLRELRRWLGPDVPVAVIKGSYSPRNANAEDRRLLAGEEIGKKLTADQARRVEILRCIEQEGWIIVNWEQLRIEKVQVPTRNGGRKTVRRMKEPLFEQTEWLAVIGDEAHRAKNPTAKQTQGLWRCRGKVMFALTGTPIMNSPDELWSLLRWLWPDQFHERGAAHSPGAVAYWPFYMDYVDFYEDHNNRKIITGVKNPDALRFILKDKLIRRTRPPGGRRRIFFDVPLNPGQQRLYDEAEKAMWLAVQEDVAAGNKDAIAFAQAAVADGNVANLIRIPNGAARLVRLQQIIENAALLGGSDDSAIMDDMVERYEDSRPYQWVVYCKFKASCELLAERLRKKGAKVGVYNGDVRPQDRTELEDAFLRGELDVMVGTVDAMYQGINLQSAHLMYFITRSFVPAIDDQAEAREDREGQTHEVLVYIPQALDTVATSKVEPIVTLKQTIERTVLPKTTIQEDRG